MDLVTLKKSISRAYATRAKKVMVKELAWWKEVHNFDPIIMKLGQNTCFKCNEY